MSSTKTGKNGVLEKLISAIVDLDKYKYEFYTRNNNKYLVLRGENNYFYNPVEIYIKSNNISEFKELSKSIKGIFQIRVHNGVEYLKPCEIIFNHLNNIELDLSFLAYSKDDMKKFSDTLIRFDSCENITIKGKIEIEGPFRMLIDFCKDYTLSNFKSKDLALTIWHSNEKEIKNCVIKTLKITPFSRDNIFNDYQDVFSDKIYFSETFDNWLADLTKTNKIKIINLENHKYGSSSKIMSETSNGKISFYIVDKQHKKELEKLKMYR